ncbi:dihydrofolate reductase family protein [Enterococcus sp. LJL128]|uniref:dihydrofolate reductase family protein n=1 Tax=Enterococcus sp. LJL51 TaxID=3416656 RepID=UPI003CEB83B9
MNRKVILYIAMSLDGYIAEEDGSVDFLTDDIEMSEKDDSYEKLMEQIDTVILGRKTYDQVVNELSPEKYPYEEKHSYVLTHNVEEGRENLTFTDEKPTALIQRLLVEDGKDIWIVGGGQVVAPLVASNLIDEYIITTIPIVLGKGIPLFQQIDQSVKLKNVQSYSKNGLVTSVFLKI